MAKVPLFADYHRTVVGYHGTLQSTALEVVGGRQELKPSIQSHDWLGHGVYFWEYSPRQAWRWAAENVANPEGEPVAVVASMIRLGNCLDLVDPLNAERLKLVHERLCVEAELSGAKLPKNVKAKKRLDCRVFEYAYQLLEDEEQQSVDTCRAIYVPSKLERLWRSSWLSAETHAQLCVRNTDCIIGTWLEKPVE